MNKNIKHIYIIEICMIITLILLQIFFLINNTQHYQKALLFYNLAILVFFYYKYGIARDKKIINKICFRYMIAIMISYIIIIYLLGIFTGFVKTAYSISIINILKNIIPVILITLSKEIVRFTVYFQSQKKYGPLILLTIIYICADIIPRILFIDFNNTYYIFTFITVTVLPLVARNILSSYIVSHFGVYTSIVYNLTFALAPYVLPIYPDLGNYLSAVLGLLLPAIILIILKKILSYNEKVKKEHVFIKFIGFPIIIFIIIIMFLISGIFNLQIIAIGSDSMNPIYYRGDAIIYEKIQASEIKQGDILVFKSQNTIITHRVVKIIQKENELFFKTKGDNNESEDLNLVKSSDVLGKVKFILKYIGYPTIWFNKYIRG